MTLVADLIETLDAVARKPVPLDIVKAASLHLMDSVGVGLAANATDVGGPYRAYAQEHARDGGATVFGQESGADAATAAMINGGLIHSLEYDDTHTGSIVHGSAVLSSTALATGEMSGASGEAVLVAYGLGWEMLVRMGEASPGGFQAAGFQITSVGGALAAAYIAARLSAMDANATAMAMGIALSQASGVFEFLSNGSSVKSLHPGWAAHAGITAAQLARYGMTGPETSLEGRYGLFASFARDPEAAEGFRSSLDSIGHEWKIASAAFKFYPCCHYIHPFIEAARRLMQQRVSPDAISEIVCRVPRGAAPVICEPWPDKQRPASSHAARWSLPVVVAAQIVEGRVDLDTFSRPISREVLRLASRITWKPLEPDNFPKAFEAEVTFTLSDGTSHNARIDDVFGNVGRPATEEDVRIKFRTNALRKLPEAQVQALEASIDRLTTSPGLARFTAACRGKEAS